MKYTGMHTVAFDQQNVAFPGLGNCHGIAHLNANGMFAYHLAGQHTPTRTQAFAHFVAHHPNGGGAGTGLHGFCPANRHDGGDEAQKAGLKVFADALGYQGRLHGHRWDIKTLGWRSTFVDVHFNRGALICSIGSFGDVKEQGANPAPADMMWVHLNAMPNPVPKALDNVTLYALRDGTPSFFTPRAL